MDRTSKSVIAVSLLILGLLLGTNYMVTEEPETNWLVLALVLLGGAFFFWLWIRREDRQAEEVARQSLEEAERQIASIEDASQQAVLESKESAEERVEEALERAGIDTREEPESKDLVEQDAIFEENKAPQDTTEDIEPQLSVVEDISAPPGQEVIEGARAGDSLAEKQIAEAEAQKPVSDDVAEVTPQDVEAADEALTAGELQTEAEATADDEPDDLTIIEGIGPAYQRYLKAAGITTFAQIAEMNEDEIVAAVEEQGGRKAASMESWAEQAKLAADGKWDELEALQDELMGGRR